MSGFALNLTLDDASAMKGVGALLASLGNLRPVLNEIGAELEKTTLDRFETGVGPDGIAWKPSRRAAETGGQTLVESTALRDSVHYVADDHGVEIGAGGPAGAYAPIHQFGGTITAKDGYLKFRLGSGAFVSVKSVTIPARPYVGLSAEDERTIPSIVGAHLAGVTGQVYQGGYP